jgi:hypothetical protein
LVLASAGGAEPVEGALLATPPTVTTTFPLVAPAGTGTLMVVADHVVGVAGFPLKVTALVPCVAPRFVPVIVTAVPTGPLAGERPVNVGSGGAVVGGVETGKGTSAEYVLSCPAVL